jgi:hypothetical protein
MARYIVSSQKIFGIYITKEIYCDVLLKALRYGTRKHRVTWSTTELRLLSSEGLNNHNRGTTEDVSLANRYKNGSYTGEAKRESFMEVISIRFDQNLPHAEY